MVVKRHKKTRRKQRIRRVKTKRLPQHGGFLNFLAPVLGTIAKPLLGGLFGGMGGQQQQQQQQRPPPPPPPPRYYPPPKYRRPPPRYRPPGYNLQGPGIPPVNYYGGPTRQRYV